MAVTKVLLRIKFRTFGFTTRKVRVISEQVDSLESVSVIGNSNYSEKDLDVDFLKGSVGGVILIGLGIVAMLGECLVLKEQKR